MKVEDQLSLDIRTAMLEAAGEAGEAPVEE